MCGRRRLWCGGTIPAGWAVVYPTRSACIGGATASSTSGSAAPGRQVPLTSWTPRGDTVARRRGDGMGRRRSPTRYGDVRTHDAPPNTELCLSNGATAGETRQRAPAAPAARWQWLDFADRPFVPDAAGNGGRVIRRWGSIASGHAAAPRATRSPAASSRKRIADAFRRETRRRSGQHALRRG